MSVGDLLFLAALVVTAVALIRGVYLLLRRHPERTARVLRRWGAFVAVYVIALVSVSMLQRTRPIAFGESHCFDEWCLVVDGATRQRAIGATPAVGEFVVVATHTQNKGRRPQRESDVYSELRDESGTVYLASTRGQTALHDLSGNFSTLRDSVDAGQSRAVQLVFDVPRSARQLGLVVRHDWFPHALIIGDPESLLHRPAVVSF